MAELDLESVSVSVGSFRLDDITMTVPEGSYTMVLGPSGAGKTVLLETVAGFHRPGCGRIILDGRDITRMPPNRRNMGFVYQDYMLFPHMTVSENIEYPMRYSGLTMGDLTDVIDELEITDILDRRPATLSGGERQRVAIARALASAPSILLLDEPFAALDHPTTVRLRGMLSGVHRSLGISVVHVTHSREDALVMGSHAYVLISGRIASCGTVAEVFSSPGDEDTASFLGMDNIFDAVCSGGTATAGGLVIRVNTDVRGRCRIALRPEDIIISRTRLKSSARNVIPARVVSLSEMYRGVMVSLVPEAEEGMVFRAFVTRGSVDHLGLKEGQRVFMVFKASSVRVLK